MSLELLQYSRWTPQPYLVYKPSPGPGGVALKVHARVDPVWEEKGPYQNPNTKGQGVFLELAAQVGKSEAGFPTFDWTKTVRAKLGLADLSKVLVSIREVRHLGKAVPTAFQGKGKSSVVSLFHKFGDSGTAINYGFEEERSILRVSKSKDLARSISLDLAEEYALEVYLHTALENFLRVGVR